jgi:hypothetical protein
VQPAAGRGEGVPVDASCVFFLLSCFLLGGSELREGVKGVICVCKFLESTRFNGMNECVCVCVQNYTIKIRFVICYKLEGLFIFSKCPFR